MDRDNMGLDSEDLEEIEIEALPSGLETNIVPEGIEIIEEEDGGVILDFEPQREGAGGFYDNLAEELDDRELGSISSELAGEYDSTSPIPANPASVSTTIRQSSYDPSNSPMFGSSIRRWMAWMSVIFT